MTDLGTDVGTPAFDVDEDLGLVSGRALLIQDLLARFDTSRGDLFYDANYGFALVDFLGEPFDAASKYQIEAGAAAECLKDPRVAAASAKAQVTGESSAIVQTLRLVISIEDDDGPFELVIDAANASLTLVAPNLT